MTRFERIIIVLIIWLIFALGYTVGNISNNNPSVETEIHTALVCENINSVVVCVEG